MICTYRDYASEEELQTTSVGGQAKFDLSSVAGAGDVAEQVVFPVKLHAMLGQVERLGLDHVVGWASHGRCFFVRNKDAFVNQILAMWFRQSKFASFQRQLNLYAFKRITTGRDKGGYYHEFFLRGKSFLCQRMERIKIKGSKPGRVKAYADSEPDFYSLPPLPSEEPKTTEIDQEQGNAAMARSDPAELPPLRSLAALDGGTSRTLPQIRPIERELSSRDFGMGEISFLSNQPQPMTLSRNSPPNNSNTDKEQKHQSPGSLPLRGGAGEGKQDDHDPLSMLGMSNDGSAFSVVHPILQSSGRTSLVSLRDIGSIFGTGAMNMGGVDANQLFANLMNMNMEPSGIPPQPLAAPSLSSLGQQQAQRQYQNQQQNHQQLQPQGRPEYMSSMDMFQMQNDMLSEFLPTAQSLALADLFENDIDESLTTTAAAAFGGDSTASPAAEVASVASRANAGAGIGVGPPQARVPAQVPSNHPPLPLLPELFPRPDAAAGGMRQNADINDGDDQGGRMQGGLHDNQNMSGYR